MRMKKAASIVAMKALVNHDDTDMIFLITPRDLWIYDADSVEADDATDVIQPTNEAGAGRWLRIKFKAEDLDGSSGMPSHASAHETGGADEVDVTDLAGVLADPQTPAAHKASHENNGADEISVAGLSGTLADPQTPAAHTHTLVDITDAGDAAADDVVTVAHGGLATGTKAAFVPAVVGGAVSQTAAGATDCMDAINLVRQVLIDRNIMAAS